MHYSIEELTLRNDSEEEQNRTRLIFEDLKEKVSNGIDLTSYELDFFCTGVLLSKIDDGSLEDYPCCEIFKFKMLYFVYFHDLSGNGIYKKLREDSYYVPSKEEVESDLKFLDGIVNKWHTVIQKTNHSDELLQQTAKETRNELKKLNKNGRIYFNRDKERQLLQKKLVILQSKFICWVSLQVFEKFQKEDFVLSLNGVEIIINEYSLVHILSRHFSQITKPYSEKSFHTENFEPRYLNVQLRDIFDQIDKSGILKESPLEKVCFKFQGSIYVVWTKKRIRQIKGKGNIPFYRVESFYPIEDNDELNRLVEEYDLEKVNDFLEVYKPKV